MVEPLHVEAKVSMGAASASLLGKGTQVISAGSGATYVYDHEKLDYLARKEFRNMESA